MNVIILNHSLFFSTFNILDHLGASNFILLGNLFCSYITVKSLLHYIRLYQNLVCSQQIVLSLESLQKMSNFSYTPHEYICPRSGLVSSIFFSRILITGNTQ